jgi:CRISPR-associated protein Cas2
MRILLFFDLPTLTSANRRSYAQFRKYLIKNGFIRLQESVYCKLALNPTVLNAIINGVRNNKPEEGLVQILTLTEKQFSKMEIITGECKLNVLDSDERLVIL